MTDLSAALRDAVSGPVFGPEDDGYADEVAAFNTAVRHAPDVVVGVLDDADVRAAVEFAGVRGLPITVQSTGHTEVASTSGVFISTRRLRDLAIDPDERVARIGAGLRWTDVIRAAAPSGLFPIVGSAPGVGVIGYLLGGGFGPLIRSHGVSSDRVLGFTVVSGAGEILNADVRENSDLFWALRGGKNGLGIVTSVRLGLVPLTEIYAGALTIAQEHVETALRAWVDWTARADPDVSTSVSIAHFPPLPDIPEVLRGRWNLLLRFAFPGATDRREQLAGPLRAFAPAVADTIRVLPVTEIGSVHNDPTEPGPSWISGLQLTGLDQDAITVLLREVGPGTDGPLVALEIRHLGAAVATYDWPSAVGGRDASFVVGMVGVDPAEFERGIPRAAAGVHAALEPWRYPETNINFIGVQASPGHPATAWSPDTQTELDRIRRRYDPAGVFRDPSGRAAP